jgi:hypothetical protein
MCDAEPLQEFQRTQAFDMYATDNNDTFPVTKNDGPGPSAQPGSWVAGNESKFLSVHHAWSVAWHRQFSPPEDGGVLRRDSTN